MSSEDLNERDLQRRNLSVQEDTGQVQLHLEAHIHIGSVDSAVEVLIMFPHDGGVVLC